MTELSRLLKLAGVHLTAAFAPFLTLVLGPAPGSFAPRPLSPFQMQKAEWLLRHRLPCLGCHELDGDGGRIGPSLGALGGRRPAAYVYDMMRDPARTAPGTIMPRIPMDTATLALVASYLLERHPASPASGGERPPGAGARSPIPADPAGLYQRSCAPCHGPRGAGDGYNAPFLPVRPTAHADSAYMSTRSDDELFDTIFAGGYVMNRSNRMPAFGETLSRAQIWALVHYLRTLCRCAEPAWAVHS